MKEIIKIFDNKIKEFKQKEYKKVTYNIGFIEGLKFAKVTLKNFMKKD